MQTAFMVPVDGRRRSARILRAEQAVVPWQGLDSPLCGDEHYQAFLAHLSLLRVKLNE